MSKRRMAALGLFATALLLYLIGASSEMAGGFIFVGFIVEAMAWRKL